MTALAAWLVGSIFEKPTFHKVV